MKKPDYHLEAVRNPGNDNFDVTIKEHGIEKKDKSDSR